jgi:hypothetical protein
LARNLDKKNPDQFSISCAETRQDIRRESPQSCNFGGSCSILARSCVRSTFFFPNSAFSPYAHGVAELPEFDGDRIGYLIVKVAQIEACPRKRGNSNTQS